MPLEAPVMTIERGSLMGRPGGRGGIVGTGHSCLPWVRRILCGRRRRITSLGGIMSIASMTGFARAEVVSGDRQWVWELRSVNGRGLDIRCRLPNGYDALDHLDNVIRIIRGSSSRV